MVFQVIGNRGIGGIEGAYARLDAPYLVDGGLDSGDKVGVHLLAVVEEPRAALGLRHIAQYHN